MVVFPNGSDDVVVEPLLALDREFHFLFDLLAGKGSPIVLPPYRQRLLGPGDVFGALSDRLSPVPLAGRILDHIAAVGANGEKVEGQAFDDRLKDGPAFGQLLDELLPGLLVIVHIKPRDIRAISPIFSPTPDVRPRRGRAVGRRSGGASRRPGKMSR